MTPRKIGIGGALIAAAAVGGWIAWTRSDNYQFRACVAGGTRIVAKHAAMSPALISEWFTAAALRDRDAAVRALRGLPSGAARDQAVSAMARALLSAGRVSDSLAVAAEIRDAGELAAALKAMATPVRPKPSGPDDLAGEIKSLLDQERPPAIASELLSRVPGALAELGFTARAAAVVGQFSDPADQALAFVALSERFNEAGKIPEAVQARREALRAAGGIAAPRRKLTVLMRLMVSFHAAGELALAHNALEYAVRTAGALPDAEAKVRFLPVLASAFEKADDPVAAHDVLAQAADAARTLAQPAERATAFVRILALQRNEREIEALVREVAAMPPEQASPALSAAAGSLARIGRPRPARLLAERCDSPADRLAAFTAILRSAP